MMKKVRLPALLLALLGFALHVGGGQLRLYMLLGAALLLLSAASKAIAAHIYGKQL